jgi:hypothetical protein
LFGKGRHCRDRDVPAVERALSWHCEHQQALQSLMAQQATQWPRLPQWLHFEQ